MPGKSGVDFAITWGCQFLPWWFFFSMSGSKIKENLRVQPYMELCEDDTASVEHLWWDLASLSCAYSLSKDFLPACVQSKPRQSCSHLFCCSSTLPLPLFLVPVYCQVNNLIVISPIKYLVVLHVPTLHLHVHVHVLYQKGLLLIVANKWLAQCSCTYYWITLALPPAILFLSSKLIFHIQPSHGCHEELSVMSTSKESILIKLYTSTPSRCPAYMCKGCSMWSVLSLSSFPNICRNICGTRLNSEFTGFAIVSKRLKKLLA